MAGTTVTLREVVEHREGPVVGVGRGGEGERVPLGLPESEATTWETVGVGVPIRPLVGVTAALAVPVALPVVVVPGVPVSREVGEAVLLWLPLGVALVVPMGELVPWADSVAPRVGETRGEGVSYRAGGEGETEGDLPMDPLGVEEGESVEERHTEVLGVGPAGEAELVVLPPAPPPPPPPPSAPPALGEGVGQEVGMGVGQANAERVTVCVGVPEPAPPDESVGEMEEVRVGVDVLCAVREVLRLGVVEGETVEVAEAVGLGEAEAWGEAVGAALGVVRGVRVAPEKGEAVEVEEMLGEAVAEGQGEGEPVKVFRGVGVGVGGALPLTEGLPLALGEGERVPLPDREPLSVGESEASLLGLPLTLRETLLSLVEETVGVVAKVGVMGEEGVGPPSHPEGLMEGVVEMDKEGVVEAEEDRGPVGVKSVEVVAPEMGEAVAAGAVGV